MARRLRYRYHWEVDSPTSGQDLSTLVDLLRHGQVCLLTGAGMSTASGIPDYRGPSANLRRDPIQFREFRDDAATRARYWARSAVGWPWIRAREPNPAHAAVAKLESLGVVLGVITQNVDGLHQRAGSRNVLELHGSLDEVVCLNCGKAEPREIFQDRLPLLNPGWDAIVAEMNPDGDAEIGDDFTASFSVPPCRVCRGVLKPNVVFFGESVPHARVETAFSMVESCASLIVLGSSLTVFSGYRFVKHARSKNKPVAILNQGKTRGDPLAQIVIDKPLEECLPHLVRLFEME